MSARRAGLRCRQRFCPSISVRVLRPSNPIGGRVRSRPVPSRSTTIHTKRNTLSATGCCGPSIVRFRPEASAMPASAPARQLDVDWRVPAAVIERDRLGACFSDAMIVPIHRDGRAHFTQNAKDLEDPFKAARHRFAVIAPRTRRAHADHGFLKSAPSTCVKLISHFGAEWKGGIYGPQKN